MSSSAGSYCKAAFRLEGAALELLRQAAHTTQTRVGDRLHMGQGHFGAGAGFCSASSLPAETFYAVMLTSFPLSNDSRDAAGLRPFRWKPTC